MKNECVAVETEKEIPHLMNEQEKRICFLGEQIDILALKLCDVLAIQEPCPVEASTKEKPLFTRLGESINLSNHRINDISNIIYDLNQRIQL